MLDANIFNTDPNYKTVTNSLFLERKKGLLDSINKRCPTIWALYKKLKNMDWDENEFPYKDCLVEFANDSKDSAEMMIDTLAWQWETDSIAAHHLVPLFAPFVSSSEYWVALCEIQRNENVHALTYSEIVRNSFEDPDAVMASVLSSLEPLKRLNAVTKVMAEAMEVGSKINLGMIDTQDPVARDTAMKLLVAIFCMERIQFMPSFGVTFSYAEVGQYTPIGDAVQKICNDEFNIHVEVHREALRNELSTKLGQESFERIKPLIAEIVREVTQSELNWTTEHLFRNGRQRPGCTSEMMCDFVRFSATDVYNELPGITNPFGNIWENPLPYVNDWVNMDKRQTAPQEQKPGNYLLGGFVSIADDKVYDTDGI